MNYATFLQAENYFAGIRLSTLTPESVRTKDSVFNSVIPYANPPDSYHGWDIDLSIVNKTAYGGNEYKEEAGKFGEGVVKFLRSNQSLKSALNDQPIAARA